MGKSKDDKKLKKNAAAKSEVSAPAKPVKGKKEQVQVKAVKTETVVSKVSAKGKKSKAKPVKAPPPKEESSDESSETESSDEEPKPKSKTAAANGASRDDSDSDSSSSSESEEEKPKADQIKSVKRAASSSDSSGSDSSDDDKPMIGKKTASKKAAKPTPAKKDDSSDSSDSSSESEDEKPSIGAKKTAKSTPAKKADSSDSSSDSSSESEDEKPSIGAQKSKSTSAKKADDSSESDSEDSSDSDDEKPKATKSPSDSSSSSEGDSDVEMGDGTTKSPVAVNGKRKAPDTSSNPTKKVKLANGDAAPADGEEPTKSIFVGQLSWSVDNDWLASEFASCGEVVSATVQMDRNTGKSRGFGYVHFASADAVEKALETMQGKEIDGRNIKIDKSRPVDPAAAREKRAKFYGDDKASPPSSTLFVGNLSFTVNEDMVWEAFNEYGVKNVRLPTERETGRLKGFGYVEFEDVAGAKNAFDAMKGQEIDGRSIRLDFSQPRDAAGGGGRGGRGGFGDRGRGFGDRGRGFGDRGRGGRGGRGGDRGGRGGRGRGAPRGAGNPRSGGIVLDGASENKKIKF